MYIQIGSLAWFSGQAKANAPIVAHTAEVYNVDPTLAVAVMLQESSGNARAVGDNGTSFGLFQLHAGGGELGDLTQEQAFEPWTNATVALNRFANVQRKTGLTGPALAAASQNPADPIAYQAIIATRMPLALNLLKQVNWTPSLSQPKHKT